MTIQGIFQAIHFYLQPEITLDTQNALRQSITELGGHVDAIVPENGYVLADLNSKEPERTQIFQLFTPDRWVVPLSYVETCRAMGVQLKPIFLDDGRPMHIHIHESIANINFRQKMCERIMECAGYPYATIESARVILADAKTNVFNALVKTYQLTPHKFIETLEWVDKCIERQDVIFTPHVFKNPGGRRAGEERTQFSEEDEQKLCEWIAAKIPYKSTGGRTGNKLYQQLFEMRNHPEFTWVTRHTWQSWRERYKKNADRLDKIIDSIVTTTKPTQGEKWQYGYVRQDDERPKKKRRRISKPEEEDQRPPLQPQQQEFVLGSSGSGKALVSNFDPVTQAMATNPSFGQLAGMLRLAPTSDISTVENNEDGWGIRVGSSLPPSWPKPKDADALGQDHDSKSKLSEPPTMTDETLQLAMVAVAQVLDQNLADIARQTRFTVEEVREYYDKSGDVERTNRRFHKMREHLNLLPDDDP
ncbi:hypothetical protein D9757_002781 [Collybiopsis confluens]|uniref:TERF2-interacting telomeric protein 1 Myb domain-containing protein n=1 Tax=Collybiopsis confluens TaxID=2823264 RepID=A0A8H5HVI9_9AGAR|nr:hypothetical protein D9757_002781 [Collybiopsis confluens]